jgi:hypothetical protein
LGGVVAIAAGVDKSDFGVDASMRALEMPSSMAAMTASK